ncbi:hypothetical protein RB195_000949 [Necator americanus]|uniref:Uncharacterized protein n=1 Tax=Necator americanus TaxID=51031 RepID=A0ABR1DC29_NECAM
MCGGTSIKFTKLTFRIYSQTPQLSWLHPLLLSYPSSFRSIELASIYRLLFVARCRGYAEVCSGPITQLSALTLPNNVAQT